ARSTVPRDSGLMARPSGSVPSTNFWQEPTGLSYRSAFGASSKVKRMVRSRVSESGFSRTHRTAHGTDDWTTRQLVLAMSEHLPAMSLRASKELGHGHSSISGSREMKTPGVHAHRGLP